MKRLIKVTAISLCMIISAIFMCSCGGKRIVDDDKRPSLFISVFNGGYGKVWLDKMVKDYNAENPDNKYKISVRDSKDEFHTIATQITAGTAVYDMFFSSGNIYKLIDGNYLEPLTEVANAIPESSDKSIKEMLTKEEYLAAYAGKDNKVYAIPFLEAVKSFVYDHDLFLKYGLLFNEEGAFINAPTETLSKGKDGKQGTYDDGHPITEAQWEAMVIKANQLLGVAFNYSGKFASYLNDLYLAMLAQYDGVDTFATHFTFNGEYDLDGDGIAETKITPENGYLLADAPGKRVALEFIDKYLACKDTTLKVVTPYVYNKAGLLSYSHTDAQNDFILFSAQNKAKKIAMLYEGDWWENESMITFEALEAGKYNDYKFRTRNYKFMTLPIFEGQKEQGNVYPIGDAMFVALKKQTDNEKKLICKDFITYMYQPENIQNFAITCGGIMPYDVELTTEQTALLSPFAKNLREIYYDSNNKFISQHELQNSSKAIRAGMPLPFSNGSDWVIMSGLYYCSAADYLLKQKTSWTERWSILLENYNNYI